MVLVACLGVALAATLSLSLVWEAPIDGENYRRLYTDHFIKVVFVGMSIVGCVLIANEIFRWIRIPFWVFPATVAVFIAALVAMTAVFTFDFEIKRRHPQTGNRGHVQT